MIEKIVSLSLRYPFSIVLAICLLACYGFYSLTHLPIDAVPDITTNQVQINTVLTGFSPTQMEKQVTFLIENALAGIPGLQMTRSLSRHAFSQVTAIFEDHVDLYFARQQINERLNEIKEYLPEGAEPRMGPITTGLGEIYMWMVHFKHPNGQGAVAQNGKPGWQSDGSYLTPEGDRLETDSEKGSYLRTVQDWLITPQLRGIQGLAGIDTIGGYLRQYHVEPNIERLMALGLNFDHLLTVLKRNNLSIGPGYIEKNGEAYLIEADERLQTIQHIEDLVVTNQEGFPIRIKDLAVVKIGKDKRTGSASKDGEEGVVGTAMMLIGANSRTVSQEVDGRLLEINRSLPIDIEATPVLNRTKLVNATIHTVAKNLSEGALLVIFVLFLFLGYFRAACIVACVIPLALLMTAIGMVQTNISGNLMSLGALDFGLIVDGAIIITENCLRRLRQKQQEMGRQLQVDERLRLFLAASKEMLQPSVFGQAIIITVYIPLLTLSGVEGKMFHPMAMTVILALISAFILSLTFIPAMIAIFIKGEKNKDENQVQDSIGRNLYRPLLEYNLQFPWIAIGAAAVLICISGMLFFRLGQEFVPTLDEKDLAMHAMRIPSTSLTQSTAMQLEIEKVIKELPEVAYVYSKTGTAEMASDPMPPHISDTFIMLKPQEDWPNPHLGKESLIAKIEAAVQKLPGNSYEFTQPIEMRFNELISGVRSDVAIKIYGDQFAIMQRTAETIASLLKKMKGAFDVKVAQTIGQPVLQIKIDREAASRLGMNLADGLEGLAIGVGGRKAGQLFEGDKRFDLVLKLPDEIKESVDALGHLPIPINGGKGHFSSYIPLREIAQLRLIDSLNEIQRENGKRFVSIQANVRGRDLGSFVEEAKAKMASQVKIPEGYWLAWGGQFEHLTSARNRLLIVIPICFALIFMLLFMALQSVKQALLVFSGVPLALTGGIIALWLLDMPFSISAAVGCIAVSGVAVLNGLVLITAINQMRQEKQDIYWAIAQGSLTRLRPVLMTALVASLGFIPMALAMGTGAEVQKPLAIVVIGGLMSSTLLTLVVLPALYQVFYGEFKSVSHAVPCSSTKIN